MIKNEFEHKVMLEQSRKFAAAIQQMEEETVLRAEDSPILYQASIDGLKSLHEEILEELAEYEALKRGEIHSLHVQSLQDLPEALVKARIARGWSQADLAQRLRLPEDQLQKYENEEYEQVPFFRLIEVASVLEVRCSALELELAA